MAAANFSRDVIEMFYGSIVDNQGLPNPITPSIGGFKIDYFLLKKCGSKYRNGCF